MGYLMAALVYGTLFTTVGWRGMFVIGALPAFLVIYIRTKVDESPAWLQGRVSRHAGGWGFGPILEASFFWWS